MKIQVPDGYVIYGPSDILELHDQSGIEFIEKEEFNKMLYKTYVDHFLRDMPAAYRRLMFPAVYGFALRVLGFPGQPIILARKRGVVAQRKVVEQHISLWRNALGLLERMTTTGIWPFATTVSCPVAALVMMLAHGQEILNPLFTWESSHKKAHPRMGQVNRYLKNLANLHNSEGQLEGPEMFFKGVEADFIRGVAAACNKAGDTQILLDNFINSRMDISRDAKKLSYLTSSQNGKRLNGDRGRTSSKATKKSSEA